MKVLITGGCGYIGSITNSFLRKRGYDTVIFDNLSTGHRQAAGNTRVITGDLLDADSIRAACKTHSFDAVIHFAALALAGESMRKPASYYRVNVQGGINLLEAMRESGCECIVFSSTCSVFGYPKTLPVTETSPKKPVSVYGESKLMFEQILARYDGLFGIKSAVLRYFNAAGALPDGSLGEDHTPETHIIPNAIHTLTGQKSVFELFGTDYDTKDGTCVRDYIHVHDLATAHEKALTYLAETHASFDCNLGSGHGYRNWEIIAAIESVSGKTVPVKILPRRPGDPDAIYADYTKAQKLLGWRPTHSTLKEIIGSAWHWHSSHPTEFNSTRTS